MKAHRDPAAEIQRAVTKAFKTGRKVDEVSAEEDENGVVWIYEAGVCTHFMHRSVFDQVAAHLRATSASPKDE